MKRTGGGGCSALTAKPWGGPSCPYSTCFAGLGFEAAHRSLGLDSRAVARAIATDPSRAAEAASLPNRTSPASPRRLQIDPFRPEDGRSGRVGSGLNQSDASFSSDPWRNLGSAVEAHRSHATRRNAEQRSDPIQKGAIGTT